MINRKLCMRGMSRLRNILVSTAVSVLSLAAALNAQIQANIPPRKDYAPVAKTLESLIRQEIADKDLPAFSIALVDGNEVVWAQGLDRKSTRLNSSHLGISYAVFCLKK